MSMASRHRPPRNLGILLLFFAIGVIAAIGVLMYPADKPKPNKQEPVRAPAHEAAPGITASFAIFTNGTRRDFTDPTYHNRSGDLYIDATSPNTIQVREAGRVWGDFFNTLPMQLTAGCLTTGTGQIFCSNTTHTLKFFINGKEDPGALEHEIHDGDSLLISYGPKNDPEIASQMKNLSP